MGYGKPKPENKGWFDLEDAWHRADLKMKGKGENEVDRKEKRGWEAY